MKKIAASLKNFFFPPAGAPTWVKMLPYLLLGLLTLVLLTSAAYGWEYTNSPEFCGTSCHTMPPEYTAYQVSPHARIDCVDCHIGKGFIATRITRKAGDLKHIVATTFKTYEFPIRADEMRPARETCELCHFPEKFSDDSLREIKRFSNDKENTPISIFITSKTGGGSQRLGLGRGIHWHIENPVYYYAADPEQQQIPYIQVVNSNGGFTEYVDIESGFDPSQISPDQLEEMDCITCHNRITHLVKPPDDTVDRLIASGLISAQIPEIRRKAVEVYSQIFESTQMGLNNIAGLENYYQTYYPRFYMENSELIKQAIQSLQDAYRSSVYPEQNSDWTTHSNHIGHKDSAGCFRCHDGKHLDADNKAIRLECNLCHSIPVVTGPSDYVARLEISRGPEPESHLNQNWISLHNQVIDQSCANCHTMEDPGGVSDTSFCSNSACHGSAWEFAGFDAPGLRQILSSQIPPTPTPLPEAAEVLKPLTYNDVIGPLFQARCVSCHGKGGLQGLDLSTYVSTLAGGVSGPTLIPGDPGASLLVQKQSAEKPHFSQLTPQELQLLIDWITAGAPQ